MIKLYDNLSVNALNFQIFRVPNSISRILGSPLDHVNAKVLNEIGTRFDWNWSIEEIIETNDKIQFRHFYKRFSLQKAFQLPNSNYRSIDTKTEQPIKHNQYIYIYAILVIQNYQKS